MANSDVDPEGIYAAFFTRGNGTWHCALYVANPAAEPFGSDGLKIHATNAYGGAWIFEAASFSLITSRTLSVALRIGRLPRNLNGVGLANILYNNVPMAPSIQDTGKPFSCRIWLRAAIIELNRLHIINCPNVDNLEYELVQLANESDPAVWRGRKAMYKVSEYSM